MISNRSPIRTAEPVTFLDETKYNFDNQPSRSQNMNPENAEKLFDLSYLNQVFQGNKEMISSIISLFLDQVPGYIDEMRACVERDDLHSLHPLAHKAKSSIAMLGITTMETKILRIEFDSKHQQNMDELPQLVNQVSSECAIVLDQLRDQQSAA